MQQQQQQQFQPTGTQNPGSGSGSGTLFPIQQNTQGAAKEWSPSTSYEFEWYKALFSLADTDNKGQIAGQAAVGFFTKSGLNFNILKDVWVVADSRGVNFLSLSEFCTAMRLIAMAQSSPSIAITRERLIAEGSNPLPLPVFTGAPLPPKGLTHSQGMPSQLAYAMSQTEHEKYERLFCNYDEDADGFVTAQEAYALFSRSGLEKPILSCIWRMSDIDGDNRLNKAEFCVGMHLIICASKKHLPVPQNLPHVLSTSVGLADASAVGQVDLQQQQQYGATSSPSIVTASQTSVPELPKDISAPPAQELMKQNSAQMISNGAVPSSASPNVATSGESTKRKGHQPTSAPPPTPAMGILYSPFTSSSQWQSHTVALPSGQDEPHGLGPVEAHEILAAGKGLLDVAKSEKTALTIVLEESKEECEVYWKLLKEMNGQVHSLQADLNHLRALRSEQDGSVKDLRQRLQIVAAEKEDLRQKVKLAKSALCNDPSVDSVSSQLSVGKSLEAPSSSGLSSTKVQPSQGDAMRSFEEVSSYFGSVERDIFSDSGWRSSPGLGSPPSNQQGDQELTGGVTDNGPIFHLNWPEHSSPSMNSEKDGPSITPQFDKLAVSSSMGSEKNSSPHFLPQQDRKKGGDESPLAGVNADYNATAPDAALDDDPLKSGRTGFDDNDDPPFASMPSRMDNKGGAMSGGENSSSFDAFGSFGPDDPFGMGADPFESFQGEKQWKEVSSSSTTKKQENSPSKET